MMITTCRTSTKLQLRQTYSFSFPHSVDFAGLCYPVSSNPDLSGKEGQIRIGTVAYFFSFCQAVSWPVVS